MLKSDKKMTMMIIMWLLPMKMYDDLYDEDDEEDVVGNANVYCK